MARERSGQDDASCSPSSPATARRSATHSQHGPGHRTRPAALQLADEVQQLLLEFGVVHRSATTPKGEIKLFIGNRRNARQVRRAGRVPGRQAGEARGHLSCRAHRTPSALSAATTSRSSLTFLRAHGAERRPRDQTWLDAPQRRSHRALGTRPRRDPLPDHADAGGRRRRALVDGRFYYAEVVSGRGRRCAAGVQHPGRHRRPRLRLRTGSSATTPSAGWRRSPWRWCATSTQETVDFSPNYDGRQQEPTVLPARFPNLLVNGSGGIAVGMATNIPPHNLREVAAGVQWLLDHPEATSEELLEALIERINGPDFPTKGLIVGTHGIERRLHAPAAARSRCARSSRSRRTAAAAPCLVITELPYQVNPDALARKIAELADRGKVQRHRRPARRLVVPHRHAHGRRAQARRRRQRRPQQPLQAHAAAGHVRLQHARAGRRHAAHAVARRVHPALGDPPGRGHRPAHDASGCAGPRSARTSCAACSRRWTARRGHRADPASSPPTRRATG